MSSKCRDEFVPQNVLNRVQKVANVWNGTGYVVPFTGQTMVYDGIDSIGLGRSGSRKNVKGRRGSRGQL